MAGRDRLVTSTELKTPNNECEFSSLSVAFQKLKTPLLTPFEGDLVKVVYPLATNGDRGPDFF